MPKKSWIPPPAFAKKLLKWADHLERPLPWRGEKDPYKVWLSEMLLQQTRAEQATPYYIRFLTQYPSIHHLANAPLSEILKTWEGLGYYNRAHHLHRTAIIISREQGGIFPSSYEGLLVLPGIGPYTAAAIASFAFDRPHAVVDGNVIRVIARLCGFSDPVGSLSAHNTIQKLADQLMGSTSPSRFNQAMMDFGAVQCVPRKPDCYECPFHLSCVAAQQDMVDQWPIKSIKKPLRNRFFIFLVMTKGSQTWLVRRGNTDVWRSLYTFPSFELEQMPPFTLDVLEGVLREKEPDWNTITLNRIRGPFKQILSHQRIHAVFLEATLSKKITIPPHWIPVKHLDFTTFALPKILHIYLRNRTPSEYVNK